MFKSIVFPLVFAVIAASALIGYRPASAAATHSISQVAGLSNAMMAYGSSANRQKIGGRSLASPNRPVVHSDGASTTLGTLPGFTHSQGHDVNDAGQVVGFEFTTSFPRRRPVFWDDGATANALPLPAGAVSAEVSIINDVGVIAGPASFATGDVVTSTRGFYYDAAGTRLDMGTLGAGFVSHEIFDINSSYQAIGRAWNNTTFAFAPFLYQNGATVNLNSLLPAGSGWVLTRPIGINDAGEIVGIGTFNGTSSGFKLTPIPEPAAIAGLAMMSVAVATRRRRRRRAVW